MILNGAFNRSLLQSYSGEDYITITGQPITGNSKESVERLLIDDSFPLRYQLELIQRFIVEILAKPIDENGPARRATEVIKAAEILRHELVSTMNEIIADGFIPYESEDDDTIDARAEGRVDQFGVPIAVYMRSRPRRWVLSSDPQEVFECIYSTSALLKPKSGWSWGDVCGILGLWCIDEAITQIDAGEPFRAASWAIYAKRYYDWQFSFTEWQREQQTKEAPSIAFARQGLDARHAPNRAIKERALSIFASKEWSSQAEAARRIAAEVNRTEFTVLRWIREYKKNNCSTGTDMPLPE